MKLIGRGATAEVFDCGDGTVCKLFIPGCPVDAVKREYDNACLMEEMRLPVPKAHKLATLDSRVGIIYEKICGESVLDKLAAGESVDSLMERFALLHKRIISCRTRQGMSYKQFLLSCIGRKTPDKEALYERIEGLPDADYLCHGDYHPGNVLVGGDGSWRVIDFMNVCYGPREYDAARTFFLLAQGELPQEAQSTEESFSIRRRLAALYLEKMQLDYQEIEGYLCIIRECRKYETPPARKEV